MIVSHLLRDFAKFVNKWKINNTETGPHCQHDMTETVINLYMILHYWESSTDITEKIC